jgi:hypothetical protein
MSKLDHIRRAEVAFLIHFSLCMTHKATRDKTTTTITAAKQTI